MRSPSLCLHSFSTVADDQPSVLIQIYEGDRPFTEYNKLIGKLELTGIPPAPRGTPRIEVMFDVDADGVLTVTAVDKGTQVCIIFHVLAF